MADTNETYDEIIAEIRALSNTISDGIIAINGRRIADRLEAAHKRERGDCAKLREALCDMLNAAFVVILRHGNATEEMGRLALCADNAKGALAAPPRNCDMHTADELKVIFKSELVSELPIANEHEKNLVTITAMGVIDTLFSTTKEGGNDGSK